MPRRTVNLTDQDIEKLKIMMDDFDALSMNDVIRMAISQTSALKDLKHQDGSLKVISPDGEPMKLRM